MDKAALDNAIGQLPEPFPGPGPPVLSIQDTIMVRIPYFAYNIKLLLDVFLVL